MLGCGQKNTKDLEGRERVASNCPAYMVSVHHVIVVQTPSASTMAGSDQPQIYVPDILG